MTFADATLPFPLHVVLAMTPDPTPLSIALWAVGGLGIFLLGMRYMSEGVQAIAGNSLRRMIAAVTDNRLLATGTGVAVTVLVQSSTITTVLVVGFVNSGLMVLHQAIGVIMGANIGTTITGWVLVLQIGTYGLPIAGAGAIGYLFTKRERLRYVCMTIMGIGLIFLGLELMKNGFAPLKDMEQYRQAFLWFAADTYFGVLAAAAIGCILTFLVQSSSATLAITIGLTVTGVIPFQTAAALVLGENIGTTITAWLASIGATTNAKRAAWAHVLFNAIGVAWITAIFAVYIKLVGAYVAWVTGHNPIGLVLEEFAGREATFATAVTMGIAVTHTGFNVTNTLMFLPFVRLYARFLEWLIPAKEAKEETHLVALDVRMLDTPVIAIEQSRAEVLKMAAGVTKMLGWTRRILYLDERDERLIDKVFRREEVLDTVEHEVVAFLTELLASHGPHSVVDEGRQQMRIADEIESISDSIVTILKADLKLRNANLLMPDEQRADLDAIHQAIAEYFKTVIEGYERQRPDVLTQARTQGASITGRIKELRDRHVARLTEEKVEPMVSMAYSTMLQHYRAIREHGLNIAEAVAWEK